MGRAFEYRRASKEARWDKMSKLFPKLAKAITMAAREGGTDPEMNARLRTAILNAKAQNMPKDNIKAAIDRAAGKDTADYAEITYEGKGPHGVLFMVEAATDNNTRTVANIRVSARTAEPLYPPVHWSSFSHARQCLSLTHRRISHVTTLSWN
jgi:YebC/PmpR family DNA-binding regulatory protein